MMSWLREKVLLIRVRRFFAPRRAFRRALWRTLQAEMRPVRRVHPFFSSFVRVGVPALVVLLAIGGTGAYAYESDAVIPTHPLYPMRRAVEQVEAVAVSVSPQARANALARRMQHRMTEVAQLAPGSPQFAHSIADVDATLADTVTQTPTPSVEDVVRRVDEKTLLALETIAQKDPTHALPSIEQLIVRDAERIEQDAPQQSDELRRRFFAERLARRRRALLALHPVTEQLPPPLAPTPSIEQERLVPDAFLQSLGEDETSVATPVEAKSEQPRPLPAVGAPVTQPGTAGVPSQVMPQSGAVISGQRPPQPPVQNTTTVPMAQTQFFPHPERINNIPWAALPQEMRMRYYREYMLRMQQQRLRMQQQTQQVAQ